MSTRFVDYIRQQKPNITRLPLVHSTKGRSFKRCISEGKLIPTDCDVFVGEKLLYFFYGKPAYKVSVNKGNDNSLDMMPTCFLLKPEVDIRIKRLLPFDSGAFSRGYYDTVFKGKYSIADFALGKLPEDPQCLIECYYGNNHSYFRGALKLAPPPKTEPEALAYYKLIGAHIPNCDDRKYSIEIQTEDIIKLKGKVWRVIGPKEIFNVPNLMKRLDYLGVEDIIHYETINAIKSEDYNRDISYLVRDFYEKQGLI